MTLRRLNREPRELGSLALFADLDEPERGSSLRDAHRRQHVLDEIRHGLTESLENEARLHGWRVQALFEAIVVELGSAQLVKSEDDGACYSTASAEVKLPDYRLVLDDGELVLVEVKNVPPGSVDTKLSVGELEALERYADLNHARLLLAHYWSQGNLWTLVDASILKRAETVARLALVDALPANELGFLGDAMLATTPPLVMRLHADPDAPRALGPEEEDGNRMAQFTIGDVEIIAGDTVLVDEEERRVARALMELGGWELEETASVDDNDNLVSIDRTFRPAEPNPIGQQQRLVAPLSSLFSASFNFATLDEHGSPSRLAVEPSPGRLGNLVPNGYWDHGKRGLALWRLEQAPSVGPRSGGRAAAAGH